MSRLMLAAVVLVGSVSGARAEIGFGIRDSALSFSWLYGQAGDVRQTSGSDNPSRPLLSDGAGLVNGQSEQDPGYPYLGPWDASANWIVTHGFAVGGTRDDVEYIAATGFSSATAKGNNCTSDLTIDTNRLRLEFTVGGDAGSTTNMLFKTLFNETGALADATTRVDVFTPFGWIAVAIADSASTSSYRTELALGPGLYRVEGTAYARVVSPSSPASALYQLTLSPVGQAEPDFLPAIVPEPTSGLLALVASGSLLARRRTRRVSPA